MEHPARVKTMQSSITCPQKELSEVSPLRRLIGLCVRVKGHLSLSEVGLLQSVQKDLLAATPPMLPGHGQDHRLQVVQGW